MTIRPLDNQALEQWIRRYDQIWLSGDLDELRQHLRHDVVFVAPGFATRSRGQDAAISGYREFMDAAKILHFETRAYEFTWSNHAVIAEYSWAMRWRSSDGEQDEQGRDVLALDLEGGQIKIFWRTQIALK